MLTTGMALKKELQEFIYHCIKAWSGETAQTHIEAAGLTGDDATSTKHNLDILEGHYKPRSNEIVAATTYKQLVQGDLGLPEYIEKCKEVQQHKTLRQPMTNVFGYGILLGVRNQLVY